MCNTRKQLAIVVLGMAGLIIVLALTNICFLVKLWNLDAVVVSCLQKD